MEQPRSESLDIGYFGASTGAAAALQAAATFGNSIGAVVSRGGRPDLAMAALPNVESPTLLIVGGLDYEVLELNRRAYQKLKVEKELEIVPGATHLFEEPGTLQEVARLAGNGSNGTSAENRFKEPPAVTEIPLREQGMVSHPSASTASIDHPLCSSLFSDTALKVLRARYFLRDNAGRPLEDASGMLARVARAVASPGRLFGDDTIFGKRDFSSVCSGASFYPTLLRG